MGTGGSCCCAGPTNPGWAGGTSPVVSAASPFASTAGLGGDVVVATTLFSGFLTSGTGLYRIAGADVERLLRSLQITAEAQLADLQAVARAYLEGRDDFEPIGRADLLRRLDGRASTRW